MWCLLNDFKCCRKKNFGGKIGIFEQNMNILNTCNQVLDERMNIGNFIQDSMDLQVIRGLFLKSRHKLLLPLLLMHLYKKRDLKKKKNHTSFLRNLGERTDNPTFSIEDAIIQLK